MSTNEDFADGKILSVGAVEEVVSKIRTLTAELEQVKAERDRLLEVLTICHAPLKALAIAVKWEVAPSVLSAIKDAVERAEAALGEGNERGKR